MLSSYGKNEWVTISVIAALLIIATAIAGWWIAAIVIACAGIALLSFFRDPKRDVPAQRGAMVAPADGHVSSIHVVEDFEPFGGGPVLCIRIFLSVLDVHVNRMPCHGVVKSCEYIPGKHTNALNPQSAEDNESNLIVLNHPTKNYPIAAVRQVAGAIARTIVSQAQEGDTFQRGQRFGMIKLGSTTELYMPLELRPRPEVIEGKKVYGGSTVLAYISPPDLDRDVDEQNNDQTPPQPMPQAPAQPQQPPFPPQAEPQPPQPQQAPPPPMPDIQEQSPVQPSPMPFNPPENTDADKDENMLF